MKRLLLLSLTCLCACIVMAQSRIDRGQAAFNACNYDEAIDIWRSAAVVDKSLAPQANALIEKASRCKQLIASGNAAIKNKQYAKAEAAYKELKRLNPNDSRADNGLKLCQQGKEIERQAAEAERTWILLNSQSQSGKKDFEDFLASFPQNKFEKEALQKIQEFEDEELWQSAVKRGTEEAYQDYLEQTVCCLYTEKARTALKRIEDDRQWEYALQQDTRQAYEKYLSSYTFHASAARSRINRLNQLKCIIQAEKYFQASRIYAANEQLERADSIGIIPDDLSERYKTIHEQVLYRKCMNNKSYHSLGQNDCNLYLVLYGTTNSSRANNVSKRLKRHNRLYGKDYDELFNIGVSSLELGAGNGGIISIGAVRAAFRIGSWDFPVSFSASVGAYWLLGDELGDKTNGSYIYQFSCWQTPIQGRLKVNLFGNDNIKCYLAGGASYNLNYGVKNSKSGRTEKLDSKIIHKTNSSAFGELGICGEKYELAFFYSRDLQPLFNKEYALQLYSNNESSFKSNQRFGISWAYYFNL